MPATVSSQATRTRFEVDVAAFVGRQFNRNEARHGGRRRVGAMGGVGDEDAGALQVALFAVIGTHHQEAGEFAVSAGGGLQRYAGKTADLGQPLLQFEHQREVALHSLGLLQRMRLGKPG